MGKIVSIEGGIGAGKTTLVNYLSEELGIEKTLEHDYQNPFIDEFYSGGSVRFETELTFLLQHYSLLKKARQKDCLVLADFSIEKDIVFARLNLSESEFKIFRNVHDFVTGSMGTQDLVIFLDIPIKVLIERIRLRGRPHEVNADPVYFREYGNQLKSYFMEQTKSRVILFDADFKLSNTVQLRELGKTILSEI